jgi:hypothetical protein
LEFNFTFLAILGERQLEQEARDIVIVFTNYLRLVELCHYPEDIGAVWLDIRYNSKEEAQNLVEPFVAINLCII